MLHVRIIALDNKRENKQNNKQNNHCAIIGDQKSQQLYAYITP